MLYLPIKTYSCVHPPPKKLPLVGSVWKFRGAPHLPTGRQWMETRAAFYSRQRGKSEKRVKKQRTKKKSSCGKKYRTPARILFYKPYRPSRVASLLLGGGDFLCRGCLKESPHPRSKIRTPTQKALFTLCTVLVYWTPGRTWGEGSSGEGFWAGGLFKRCLYLFFLRENNANI